MATEACGGGTPNLGFFLEVWVHIRGVGVVNKSGGPRGGHEVGGTPRVGRTRPHPRECLGTLLAISDAPWASSGPKIISVKFQVNWTSFGFPFLQNSKTRKKTETGTGL